MKFALSGLSLGKGPDTRDSRLESVTRLSPVRKWLGSKAKRQLMERLTAQQASLVRAVALGDENYLNDSYYLDPDTGKRIAYELDESELGSFSATWGMAPIECIQEMNRAIRRIAEPARRDRYIRAAVELEILMDEQNWAKGDEEVYKGIPSYLMNGYTDMGTLASPTQRNGREKIKIDKKRMKERLVECKREGLSVDEPGVAVLARLYSAVRRDIAFDERGVERLSREYGNESIVLSKYLDKGMGVCRHLSIFFQLYLQETGIESRVVKGNLRFYVFQGRHAWNVVQLGDKTALVDVTHPDTNRPFILLGFPETAVYERAKRYARYYDATPDEQNFYKIGA